MVYWAIEGSKAAQKGKGIMAARKTVKALDLINTLHAKLTRATDLEKPVICDMIEEVLFMADAYAGYGYTFWNFDTMTQFANVDAAIAAGIGTEYDRVYYTSKLA